MLQHLFVENGGKVHRQGKGVPMGLECSPQLANLYGYSVESAWVDRKQPSNLLMKRYIDDIFITGSGVDSLGLGLPTEEEYGMKYKLTSKSPNELIYLGVCFFKDDQGAASMTYDRAVEYPIQIDRYPAASTVANPAQLGGVIMGRLVAAYKQCSRVNLFQDAVQGIFTHAYRRGYSRRLVHSVWTRFLVNRLDAANVSVKELRQWFHRGWKQMVAAESGRPGAKAPTKREPWQARERERVWPLQDKDPG